MSKSGGVNCPRSILRAICEAISPSFRPEAMRSNPKQYRQLFAELEGCYVEISSKMSFVAQKLCLFLSADRALGSPRLPHWMSERSDHGLNPECSPGASGHAPTSCSESCTSNAFATMFRMARQSAAAGRASPTPSVSSVRSAPAAPQLASMERDRAMPQKRPATERQAVAGDHKRKETGITLEARVRQYPGEMLAVSAGELHCTACKKRNLQNIKSTIDTHVRSSSHKAAVAAARQSRARDGDLRAELVSYYMSNPAEKGASTDPDTMSYRHLVVSTLLYSGIPLSKADDLRPLLERSGYSVTAAANLRPLVPKVEHMELLTVKQELDGQYISLAFDGTTRLGEAVNVVSRHV